MDKNTVDQIFGEENIRDFEKKQEIYESEDSDLEENSRRNGGKDMNISSDNFDQREYMAKMQGKLLSAVKEEIQHEKTNPVEYDGKRSSLFISQRSRKVLHQRGLDNRLGRAGLVLQIIQHDRADEFGSVFLMSSALS
jgi:hypothetical protein